MLYGILLSDVINCYKLPLLQYLDVIQALRRGDIRLLRRALEAYEDE